MTDWLSFCCLFAFGFSSLSSDEWQNKYWNWNNSIQTFILPPRCPCPGRAVSYYIIIQFDMLHDYANVCLLVVFLFFFSSPFRSIVPPRRKVWNVTRCSHRYWMQRTQSVEIFNETTFPAELSSSLVPASLFADSSSTQTFSTCSFLVSEKSFHFMPWRDNLHVVAFVSQRFNIFNNKTNTWFCPPALRAAGKLFLVQQKKRKQKPREASKANDFCFEKTSYPTRECFPAWMHSATVECLLSHFRTWVAWKLFALCDARQVPSITRESIYMPKVRKPSMQDECMDLQAL